MQGFVIRVDELAPKADTAESKEWIFVEPFETEERYPIPSAFAAYVPYLNIRLGKDRFEGEKE